MNHPIQPLETDRNGILRFKKNEIVATLLNAGPFDMNSIAGVPYDDEDRVQFAQLIGYSLSGFSELSYVSDDDYGIAERMARAGETEEAARINYLQGELDALRSALREPVARLFGMHPDDLP